MRSGLAALLTAGFVQSGVTIEKFAERLGVSVEDARLLLVADDAVPLGLVYKVCSEFGLRVNVTEMDWETWPIRDYDLTWYDVRLHDGTIHRHLWPDEDGFKDAVCVPFRDVAYVRVSGGSC